MSRYIQPNPGVSPRPIYLPDWVQDNLVSPFRNLLNSPTAPASRPRLTPTAQRDYGEVWLFEHEARNRTFAPLPPQNFRGNASRFDINYPYVESMDGYE